MLHIATYNNQPKLVDLIIQYSKTTLEAESFKQWINKPNEELLTAFLLAAFRGSIRMMEILINEGAEIHILSKQGKNAFTLAAQGDQVLAMVWLRLHGVEYLQYDSGGGTALHWAAYHGSEFATHFMLSWISDPTIINKQDNDGYSPLHLGAMSGNDRIIKRLLLRGANRRIRDNQGKIPADLALENQY